MQLSVWEKESFFAPADVVIAGGGFTGLWSAYYLKKKQPDLRVVLFDSGLIPTGASTRNAGFACFGSVTELMKDVSVMGEDKMLELVEMRYRGLSGIRKVFKKKEIDFSLSGGHELLSPVTDDRYKELHWQVNWLNKLLSPVLKKNKTFAFADEKIRTFGFAGVGNLIYTELEGSLHPGKLCQGLLQLVQSMGVRLFAGTKITRYEEHKNGVTIFSKEGWSLSAKQLLVCTNGFAKQLLPQLDMVPGRGQVLVTAPIPSLQLKGNFHFDEGFYYFRNLGNRVLLGGARNMAVEQETTEEMQTTDVIQFALESFLSTHVLPGTPYTITDRWSGIMGLGPEKLPVIKKLSPNIFCAVKMSGMGVAMAPVAAEKITGMML